MESRRDLQRLRDEPSDVGLDRPPSVRGTGLGTGLGSSYLPRESGGLIGIVNAGIFGPAS